MVLLSLVFSKAEAQDKKSSQKVKTTSATSSNTPDSISSPADLKWNMAEQQKRHSLFRARQADGTYIDEYWYVYKVEKSK